MSTVTGTRGPYAKTAKLRARAIEAAIDLFGTAGYNGATLTEVADRVGMSLTGLQHHFPDKDSLLAAVLEERDRRASAGVPEGPGVETLEGLLRMLSESEKNPGLMELQCVLSAEATSADHPAHEYFQRRYSTLRNQAVSGFEEMASRGDLVPGIDPQQLAAMVIALVDGLQLQWLLDRDAVNVEAAVRTFIRTFIPAVR
ncbi:TetR/AcrR family transcriptional regulator [Paenarthrobacter nitroguajacolicus]|uniref:TetR/AcrR family transcriptional regulator n=1 Tax=Paenarthrobacter nitroguajacolicus TaxID=211146 RepID=A0A558GNL5_PAENT|nr:TetR/AcrR family transcriptional regulator [Paenarthrobacter nitroguajacolicus]TVU58471.1 TetR/AcrR family transcriptional regulator [Paenarthrobacter nitroguajacolicus]